MALRLRVKAEPAPNEEAINYEQFTRTVEGCKTLALDTETTGIMPYHGDRIFALVLSSGETSWYFRLDETPSLPECIKSLFPDPSRKWYLHNAKFDLHQLWNTYGINGLAGTIHDTAIGARLEFNDHFSYSLDACAERLGPGRVKSTEVEEYIKEHNLWEWETIPGKKTRRKVMHFQKVPDDIMMRYACQDAEITFALGEHQSERIPAIDALLPQNGVPRLAAVLATEQALVPVIANMECFGVRVDEDYCRKALEHYQGVQQQEAAAFHINTDKEYKASPKLFAEVFADEKEKWTYTEKGNPSFESDTLETFASLAAKNVLAIRNAKSRCDFFATFLDQSDANGFVHPSFNSGGTATGRFSSSEPNFQNLTNDEEAPDEKFPVRRAIVPPDHNYCIVSMDYKQQEYRLMLDYAGELDLIEQVKGGADVHQATADLMGVSRKYAKTLNFMLLYGGGVKKLADALGISEAQARELRGLYFSKLPRVRRLIDQVTNVAATRGYVYNWAGRRYWCENQEFAYRFPNRVIQGGGADIMKQAMVRIEKEVLLSTRSTMVLTVHDELVFYIHKDDLHIVPKIKQIMEEVYPAKLLPMEVDVAHSWVSLGDLKDGAPEGKDAPAPSPTAGVELLATKLQQRRLLRPGETNPGRVGTGLVGETDGGVVGLLQGLLTGDGGEGDGGGNQKRGPRVRSLDDLRRIYQEKYGPGGALGGGPEPIPILRSPVSPGITG
jgi:DNA polymerase-1